MATDEDLTGLKLLGQKTPLPASPDDAVVDVIPWSGAYVIARFTCPEFTSLCPVTGQPDFAHITIDYAPSRWLIESKALKLLLGAYRNHGAFHERVTVDIGERLQQAVDAHWLRVTALWYPRGGIPIDVFWQIGELPPGVCAPDAPTLPYRGR